MIKASELPTGGNYALGAKPESERILTGYSILVAEDDADLQFLLSGYLRNLGARVTISRDGQEATKQALAGDFDFIFMDLQMPVMDGVKATTQLRAGGYTKKIVALTAHAFE